MRIKKENEWKLVFLASKSVYEPIVIFFGFTNSLATFQAIINNL